MNNFLYEIFSFFILFFIIFLFYILKNIKLNLGKTYIIICQIILIFKFIEYLINNKILDLGILFMFVVFEIIIITLYVLLKKTYKRKRIYIKLQEKFFINLWITDLSNITDEEENKLIEFISSIREKIIIDKFKNICFFNYIREEKKIEYSLIIFGNYEILNMEIDNVSKEENIYRKGAVLNYTKYI